MTLIKRENYRLTIKFLFDNCFPNHPEIQSIFLSLKHSCPLLSKSLDPKLGEELNIENQNESQIPIFNDPNHRNILALHYIPPSRNSSNCELLGITKIQKLPRDHDFLLQLKRAYRDDCGVLGLYHLGTTPLQWCRKVAFTSRSVSLKFTTTIYYGLIPDSNGERLCSTVGNFVRINEEREVTRYAKLLGLFVHTRYTNRYLFAVVDFTSPRTHGQIRELILHCPIFELTGS